MPMRSLRRIHRVYIQHGKTTSREQRRHYFARKEAERLGAKIAGNSGNREPADEMVRTQLSLKPDDFLNAGFGVAQDNPVFSQSFNREPAWRAFDDRMGPLEIHPLKCPDKRLPCCADGLSASAGDKDVTQNGDMAFGFSRRFRGFPIHTQTRCNLIETCGRPDKPSVSKPRRAVNGGLGPGAKPHRRSRMLQGAGRDRDVVEEKMPSMMRDILFSPEPPKKQSTFLQSAAALLYGITEG